MWHNKGKNVSFIYKFLQFRLETRQGILKKRQVLVTEIVQTVSEHQTFQDFGTLLLTNELMI